MGFVRTWLDSESVAFHTSWPRCGVVFHDSDQQVSGDSNPHLSLDCVLGSTKENFDTKMLLDPFEEQLDLPTASIKLGDSDCRQREVVGQEHQPFSGFGIFESDAAQWCVEILARVEASQHDGLIADQSGVPIDGMRIAAPGFEIGLDSRNKEAACLVKTVEPAKVDVGTVHDVEGLLVRAATGPEHSRREACRR